MKRLFIPLFIIAVLLVVFAAGWRERFSEVVDSAAKATGITQLSGKGNTEGSRNEEKQGSGSTRTPLAPSPAGAASNNKETDRRP